MSEPVIAQIRNNNGSTLVEVLVAALLTGIMTVAMFTTFGASSDYGDVSAEYTMAVALAQEQLEILATQDKAWWSVTLPYGSASVSYQAVAVQHETSPLTLTGRAAAFTITNQAKRADASDQANIVMLTTITWTNHGKTGMSRTRSYKLLNIIRDPSS